MPFISDRQLAVVQDNIQGMKDKMAKFKARAKVEQKAGEAKMIIEALLAAGVCGFIRGKTEKADGSWNIPGTTFDIQIVIALGLLGTKILKGVSPRTYYSSGD